MEKIISKNPNAEKIKSFLTVTNAYAEQMRQAGEPYEFLTAKNAPEVFKKLIGLSIAVSDPSHVKHKNAVAQVRNSFPKASIEAVNLFEKMGESFSRKVQEIATVYAAKGLNNEKAVEGAFNSLMGNPIYDHFGNLNLLSSQLYEEQIIVNSFIDSGDAINMPIVSGGDGTSLSRFRSPSEKVSGSSKAYQGDTNPQGIEYNDSNRIMIDLYNEFKNVKWLYDWVEITSDMRDQYLMYESVVAPALAGFILQQRYMDTAQRFLMKQAELAVVGGLDSRQNYVPGVGGSYGLLSDNILLEKSDAGNANPTPASGSEWAANPTKLIQKITNYWYKPTDVEAPLETLSDSSLMYKEITRLLALAAINNIEFSPREWKLFVPTAWFPIGVQYPSGGTFNKQLQEMVKTANADKIINKITIEPSSLMNYGANVGTGTNPYNYIVLMAVGSPTDKKPIVLPGQTTIPTVIAQPSTSARMNFKIQYATGGIMVKQYGGCFVLEFSNEA